MVAYLSPDIQRSPFNHQVSPMTTVFIDQDAIQSALKLAASELQAHFLQEEGELYRADDLQQALNHWLELSIESLVDDVLFHAVEGDRSYAFNREAFEARMRRMQPMKRPAHGEIQPVTVQLKQPKAA
ncbi:hypothetical protein C7B61_05000 [filamentous cyanobacterium CCP1]|nr:hypothetical protein C7B76_30045 [filamentous cyanobacterium CCP2]PSB67667.1 hypothetical protein C7B61_05000 [filamentous cyanobacterium CCP1]